MPTAATGPGPLRPPFPFFGSKRNAAPAVWSYLGDPGTYIEPFAGSLAVLLARPHEPRVEIAVDTDGLIVNFWRWLRYTGKLIRSDGTETAGPLLSALNRYIDGPLSETDIEARHRWLVEQRPDMLDHLRRNPEWFNTKAAAYWWQGVSSWLGSGWCRSLDPAHVARQRPHIDRTLKGLYAVGMSDDRILNLAGRLANVTLLCGDWTDAWRRPITTSVLNRLGDGAIGVFLDPPYTHDTGRTAGLYTDDASLSDDVFTWCVDNGDNPNVRIVLAGYFTEYENLTAHGWAVAEWTRPNGYAPESNRRRDHDVLFVSPHCHWEEPRET